MSALDETASIHLILNLSKDEVSPACAMASPFDKLRMRPSEAIALVSERAVL